MAPTIIDYAHGISTIDVEFVRPKLAASHLIVDGGEAAFVDVGTTYSAPVLLAALAAKGLAREQVRYVCVTHVHLDHAGGAGELMRHLPNATLVVHPRGERHMVDPTKLMAGTIAVYGEETTLRLYGEIPPIQQERVRAVADNDVLALGQRMLRFLDTPGHAYHHYCVYDETAAAVFSGDTFGISYRELDTAKGAFIFPTTTPIHFDPEAAHTSIDRLLGLAPRAIYLTHFSEVTELQRLGADLHADLEAFVDIAESSGGDGQGRADGIRAALRTYLGERLLRHGCRLSSDQVDEVLDMDLGLNAQGLEVWLERREASA
jgi:glyoxylase-like metal-dependent hydrolase (beta-lactamase superfamily II)